MKNKIMVTTLGFFLSSSVPLQARPFLTEEVATVGKYNFETGFFLSSRTDKFGSPEAKYTTVNFPFHAKFGFHPRLDLGFEVGYVGHRLESKGANYSGSSSARFSPQIKYAVSNYFGVMGFWHIAKEEKNSDSLPIANGGDVELVALFKIPVGIPFHFNSGYIWKSAYDSQFGVPTGTFRKIQPGNIFLNRISLEIPLIKNFAWITEAAYYLVEEEKINGVAIAESEGEAMDIMAGINWANETWILGLGAGFGLLDENHTSFDLYHGAGDFLYKIQLAYKLKPHRPQT